MVRRCLIFLFVLILFFGQDCLAKDKTFEAIDDPALLEVIALVQMQTAGLRGYPDSTAVSPAYLNTELLQRLVEASFDKQYTKERLRGIEAILRSLSILPADLSLVDMYMSLLSEQIGGLYDPESKTLFVRAGYDIENSNLARMILSHEICHAIQDEQFDLLKMGVEIADNDDQALAALTIAEGDAMVAMTEYALLGVQEDILDEIPEAFTMDQTALYETPHFFQQQLLFPYIQGQLFVEDAMRRGAQWRDRLFTDPPLTTEQLLHPEKYFSEPRDVPSALSLLDKSAKRGTYVPSIPAAPAKAKLLETNRFGELAIRLIFEERLGPGIAQDASSGWDGDAYAVHVLDDGRYWFVLETAWDSAADAGQFAGAWVTLWRSIAKDGTLGSLKEKQQVFQAGDWQVRVWRSGARVVCVWSN